MEFFDMCYFSDYIFDAFILERPLHLQTLLLFKNTFTANHYKAVAIFNTSRMCFS